jgi:hypothetical protein
MRKISSYGGLHPVGADELELLADHLVGRQGDVAALLLGREADLDVLAEVGQRGDRVLTRLGDAERVDRDVRPSIGYIVDRFRDVLGLPGVDGLDGAEAPCEVELLVVEVDRDDVPAERRRDVDRRETDPAAAVDRDPVPGRDVGAVGQRVERGHEPAAESGHLDRRDAVREQAEVDVRPRRVYLLAERPRDGLVEPERRPVLADVCVAVPAPRAGPVGDAERDDHLVALPEVLDLVAGLDHRPGGLVAHDLADEVHPGVVALPAVPVTPADATRLDVDHDAVVGRARALHVRDVERLAVLPQDCCAHTSTLVTPYHKRSGDPRVTTTLGGRRTARGRATATHRSAVRGGRALSGPRGPRAVRRA